ncbi:MAG TPA: hypothetical protein VNU46_00315 [Gemmatimonadaceae bacterium]|nr:hypothetical protein [Gemmatimonadaceae bacterium]
MQPIGVVNLSALSVGDVRRIPFSQLGAQGLTIPAVSGGGTAQYLMVVASVAGNGAATQQYTINGAVQFAGQTSLSTTADVSGPPTGGAIRATPGLTVPVPTGLRLEATLRAYERQHLSPASARSRVGDMLRRDSHQLMGPDFQIVPAVNTKITLHTLTAAGFGGATASLCDTYNTTTATVMAVSNHAIVVSDNASPSGGFTQAQFQDIAQEFDTFIYPTDSSYFGLPTDFDDNGHIIIFYTPSVNRLTAAGQASLTGYIGGFFFAGDLFPPAQCPESNQGEIFYLLTPDPFGIDGNRFPTDFVRQVTRGTIAHEFQHMINAGHRILTNAPAFEATWLDEALAHFAEDAVGRVELGFPVSQTVAINDLIAQPDSDLQAFFLQNLVRAKYYVTSPDTIGPIVSHPRALQDLAARGAEWALLRYTADQFSQGNVHSFTQRLAAGPDTGSINLTKQAGVPLDTILGNWLVTMYTDHQGIPGLPDKFNYVSYTLRSLISQVNIMLPSGNVYLPVDSIDSATTSLSVGIPPSSAAYFLITQSAGATQSIKITTTGGSIPTDPNGRIYIVRME